MVAPQELPIVWAAISEWRHMRDNGSMDNIDDVQLEHLFSESYPSARYCAVHFGVSESTLLRYIKERHGMTFEEYRNQKVSHNLQQKAIEMALKGNVACLIFALKNKSNWTDKQEVSEKHQRPIVLRYSLDVPAIPVEATNAEESQSAPNS